MVSFLHISNNPGRMLWSNASNPNSWGNEDKLKDNRDWLNELFDELADHNVYGEVKVKIKNGVFVKADFNESFVPPTDNTKRPVTIVRMDKKRTRVLSSAGGSG